MLIRRGLYVSTTLEYAMPDVLKVSQVAAGLAYMHSHGIIHGDIKSVSTYKPFPGIQNTHTIISVSQMSLSMMGVRRVLLTLAFLENWTFRTSLQSLFFWNFLHHLAIRRIVYPWILQPLALVAHAVGWRVSCLHPLAAWQNVHPRPP